jgi:hypothetical protein
MKVLLDECLPGKLKYSLSGHDCQTVPEAGFGGKKNVSCSVWRNGLASKSS